VQQVDWFDRTVEEFEGTWQTNLYKLWNRMSSGSYFPPPVKRVNIEAREADSRPMGVPTVVSYCLPSGCVENPLWTSLSYVLI